VFVIDGDSVEGFDPDGATPAARIDDVRGTVDVPVDAVPGRIVLLWITDLGDEGDGGRHRVDVSEISVIGRPGGD
jgi:hypothetical protein